MLGVTRLWLDVYRWFVLAYYEVCFCGRLRIYGLESAGCPVSFRSLLENELS